MRLINRTREVFSQDGISGVVQRTRRKLASWIDPSLVAPPASPEDATVRAELDSIVSELRSMLAASPSVIPENATTKLLKKSSPWYQRIDLPNGLTTTMDPSWVVYDGANDNSLGYRLTPQEAAQLRPLPKWMFIRSRLPEVAGKTVMEVGSNCGFFSFQFAKLGASQVTGVEVIQEYLERAEMLRGVLDLKNVQFVQKDWCHDELPPQHDIVFSADVIGHFIFPFFGLYRLLASAKKYLILDQGINWIEQPTARFWLTLGYTQYHAFSLSDSLITDFMVRCGVSREAITKHPYGNKRCLYIVDVSNATLRTRLISSDDPLWSGKFDFDREKGASYLGE